MHERIYENSLLRTLDAEIVLRLRLQPVTFELEHQIEFPGELIQNLYFVEEGMASMTTTFLDGAQVEVGMFGYESAIGVSGLMGTKRSSTGSTPKPGTWLFLLIGDRASRITSWEQLSSTRSPIRFRHSLFKSRSRLDATLNTTSTNALPVGC